MKKYLINRSEKVIVRGEFLTEHLTITSLSTGEDNEKVASTRKTTRKIVSGVVVMDENNIYGLDEKIYNEDVHLWEEIHEEDIIDIL